MADTAAGTTRKTTTKKTAEKTAKKAPAKKTAEKAAKKTAGKKSTPTRKTASARTEAPPKRRSAGGSRVAGAAREAVLDLTGRMPEAVTGLQRTDDGWQVEVEVLELERIPSTTDVLATYQVTLDEDGELEGCRRVRRYLRGSAGDE